MSYPRIVRGFLVTVAAAALPALAPTAAVAANGTAPVALQPRIVLSAGQEAQLRKAADQGIDALRRYVWRTRMIYHYRLADLVASQA